MEITNTQGLLPFDDTSIRSLMSKVKSGQFRMPDFPDPIKDLISRMLTVDPTKRITIEGIKHHPAFRSKFPRKYVIPGPLPIHDVHDPIDFDKLDPIIIETLHLIGFNDDNELKEKFAETHNNMPKAFSRIIMQNISIENLPWPTDNSSDEFSISRENSEVFLSPPEEPIGYTLQSSNPLVGKTQNNDASSGSIYSYAEAVPWVPDLQSNVISNSNISTSLKGIAFPLESVFTVIQSTLNNQNYDWFYPNEYYIICRRQSDGQFFVITASYDEDNNIDLLVCLMKGTQENFNIYINVLVKALNVLSLEE
ncbi:hypothetical protein TRFO_34464 [Tritrichomonas foetus]|uniref:non-specific serine/threonine protein kinase n=1 Tax=Tritrichomonas foetus TaxID=1144522 RepID=A0A1J4JL64_9EUKA|nr:hypothetical protein TRFO_34464 [Tritrichomonas foetus]|eukprot:OHS99151.1 hypothetical protein TRFO_34464 [Tritrichomonas foetus]